MDEKLPRRDFLRAAGRLLLLAGLGAAGVALARRGGAPLGRAGETCGNDGLCRGCAAFAGCGLPAALSARERAPGTGASPGASGTGAGAAGTGDGATGRGAVAPRGPA